MRFDLWTFALQAINALVLLWLLGRFLFKPVAGIIAARQAAANAVLDDAANARSAAEQERRAAAAERSALAAGREQALKAASDEAARTRERLLAEARSEAAGARQQARDALAAERRGEDALNARRATALGVAIADRLLQRLPDAARVDGFLDGLCARLRSLPPTLRGAFLAADAAVVLAAPRALAETELARCRQAIGEALGAAIGLQAVTDPGLLAGLELRCRGAVVGNHLRDDLDAVRRELADAEPA